MIFCIRYSKLFQIYIKKHEKKTVNPSIKIYINKIENRITFKIKTGYYPELLTTGTMVLLESIKSKITKNKDGEKVPHLEITEVVLVHCNIANNNYQQNLRVFYTLAPNKSFGQLLDISSKSFTFSKTVDPEFFYT